MMLVNHLVVSLTGWHALSQSGVLPELANVEPWTYSLVALGTALPDIDHPDSTIGSRVKWLSWPIRIVFGHRNITHSLIAMAALAYMVHLEPLLISVAFGYLLHLVGDWFTPAGLKLFWPAQRVYRSPFTIPTNSIAEYLFVWGTSALALTALHTA